MQPEDKIRMIAAKLRGRGSEEAAARMEKMAERIAEKRNSPPSFAQFSKQ